MTAYELRHKLVKDPTRDFGLIGSTIAYCHQGFYEAMVRLIESPVLSLHHLNFSFECGNPISTESRQTYYVDGRRINVRNYVDGTTGIYTTSTLSPFPDVNSIREFMLDISGRIGAKTPIEIWRINQLDVAKDLPINDQAWRYGQISYKQIPYEGGHLAVYTKHFGANSVLRYEFRINPKCTIMELQSRIDRANMVMAAACGF